MSEKKKIKVLLADDEGHIRTLMKTVFASMGAETVAEASNGKEAVELYRKHKPHITVLDINMPVMDGKEALSVILSEFPDAFVIMLTSLSSMDVVKQCLDAGAANYLRKDTPISEIKKSIKESWVDFGQAE